MRTTGLAGVIILVLATIAGLLAWSWAVQKFDAPGPNDAQVVVVLPPRSSLTQISAILEDAGLLEHGWLFSTSVRLNGMAHRLQAGEYAIPQNATMRMIMEQLASGRVLQHLITFPEGWEVPLIMARIEETDALAEELPPAPPEGSLLPETYSFVRGHTRRELVARMRAAHDTALAELWEDRAPNLPFDTPGEAVILASIVEKETAIPREHGLVAGVFVNRLRKGMRLQSDPTVRYAMTVAGTPLDRPLLRQDLKFASPYNTYVVHGLPPAPITNPGLAALRAALQPTETDALYFVANGSGGHAFATTLADHNRNVAQLRRLQRAARQKALESGSTAISPTGEQENLPARP